MDVSYLEGMWGELAQHISGHLYLVSRPIFIFKFTLCPASGLDIISMMYLIIALCMFNKRRLFLSSYCFFYVKLDVTVYCAHKPSALPSRFRNLGAVSIYRCRLASVWIPVLMIRRSRDHLIFNMGIPIHLEDGLYVERVPRYQVPTNIFALSTYLYYYK